MPQTRALPSLEEMKSELEAVLASGHLRRASALSRFLSFICEEYFNGRAESLKEYTIAVEAFGRPATFQPREDPIVRVQAIRMRECLSEYYRGEGRAHEVQIRLPKGQYVPEFRYVRTRAERKQQEPVPKPPVVEINGADLMEPAASAGTARPFWKKPLLVAAVAAPLLVPVVLLSWRSHRNQARDNQAPSQTVAPQTAQLPFSDGELRILAGSSSPQYMDQLGRLWLGDRYYKGGRVDETAYEPVTRVEDRNLWRRYRKGESFQYDIPLKPGTYELHLFFVEPVYGADVLAGGGETARVFDVFANDQTLLQAFDIFGDVGGPRTTDEKVFTDISPAADGFLHLRFVARSSEALVNGIELIAAAPGRMRPIRIATSNVPFISKKQVVWSADRYYTGGRYHPLQRTVSGTDDPELYSTERFGNFSYTIPVAQGSYTAILHFSEAYFGSSNGGQGGVGSRTFDVYFNGVALLKDFDIYREAGGGSRALRKEFRGLRPNALGKLVFTFQPVRNYPCVNAIEIVPEQ